MSYNQRLQEEMKKIKKSDSLTVRDILNMDMYEYNKELVQRAQESLRQKDSNS